MKQVIEKWTKAFSVGACCWLASILLAGPSLNVVLTHVSGVSGYNRFHDTFAFQVADPLFRPVGHWDGGYLAYRILIPIIADFFGLDRWGGVTLIWIGGLVALALVFAFLSPRIGDRNAALTTLGLSMTAFSQASHTYLGYGDAVSHMLIMVMILWPSPVIWFLCVLAGLFNDERMLISVPLALAVITFERRKVLIEVVKSSLPFVMAIGVAVLIGWLLRKGIATGAVGGRPLTDEFFPPEAYPNYGLGTMFLGILLSFGLLWIWPTRLATIVARKEEHDASRYWLGVAAYCMVAIVACALVADFWRSLASLFPLFLLAVIVLSEVDKPFVGRWMLPLVALMIVLPKLEQMGPHIRWLRPLPVAAYEFETGKSILTGLREKLLER